MEDYIYRLKGIADMLFLMSDHEEDELAASLLILAESLDKVTEDIESTSSK